MYGSIRFNGLSQVGGSMSLYELAVVGSPTDEQVAELEIQLTEFLGPFGLQLRNEVGWHIRPKHIVFGQRTPAAAVFFGAPAASTDGLESLLRNGIPILPTASKPGKISAEVPNELKHLKCLTLAVDGMLRVTTGLLECLGLLPRQRRVFLSYRRDEARAAAVQLFDALSARVFDVFLDTHGIAPGEDFQEVLWHRLCDCDVLMMLDTTNYFDSRWTTAEFGRALAKGISVLRVGWPGVNPSPRTATASQIDLRPSDIDERDGLLSDDAVSKICTNLEVVRGQSQAVRNLNLFSSIKRDVELIGGTVSGVGLHNSVHLSLPDGTEVVAYPTLGVPTSVTMNEAIDHAPNQQVALVYDHIGLRPKWLNHLEWLGSNIPAARWVRVSEAAWCFAGWGAR
jgi:hypothetical protein